jgi:hypothetical protein
MTRSIKRGYPWPPASTKMHSALRYCMTVSWECDAADVAFSNDGGTRTLRILNGRIVHCSKAKLKRVVI